MAARRTDLRKRVTEARRDVYLRRLEKRIPRGEMASALAHLHDNAKLQEFVAALTNPLFRKWTMASLAYRAGLTLHDLADAFRRVKLDEGLIRMYKHFPAAAEDVARDARSRRVYCQRCDGLGKLGEGKSERICPQCKGKCEVRVPGDADARKALLEAAGLIGRRGPLVAQQFNFSDGDALEDVMKKGRALIEAPAEVPE